jgi:adenosylcobinamide-GDP ribazoletransferase
LNIECNEMLKGLVTAFKTLTIFPVPGREAQNQAAALPFFPLVGFALGMILWALSLFNTVLGDNGWPAGVAAVMLLAGVLSTRGLHLDGLADVADAVGGALDRERRLAIMKDVRLGAFGVVALILALLCKWLAFSRLVAANSTIWVALIFMISRASQVELMATLPYAREEQGTAAPFVHDATGGQRVAALTVTFLAALGYGPLGVMTLAAALGMTLIYGGWCRKHLGGITGDLLGAGNEIIETVLLLTAATLGTRLPVFTGWGWIFG